MLFSKNQFYFGYLLFILSFVQITAKPPQWVRSLIRYVRDHPDVYQLVISFDMNPMIIVPEEELIIRLISKLIPTWKISFQDATANKAANLSMKSVFFKPRQTSIFVIISISSKHQNLSYLDGPIDFYRRIGEYQRRPKCLFIFSHGREHAVYDELLRSMWSKQYLDATILELPDEKKNDNAMVHYFIPYTNKTVTVNCSLKMNWFPDKTFNLFGFNMKVGIFHRPPSVILSFNERENTTSISGDNIILTKALAKSMNFNITWVISKDKAWQHTDCKKRQETGLTEGIVKNEINFIGIQNGRRSWCDDRFTEWTYPIKPVKLVLAVPIFPDAPSTLAISSKLLNLAILIMLFLLVWGAVKLMQFESGNWKMIYTVQIVLGSSAPQSPRKVAERIVFGSFLLCCMLNSSLIFSLLTNVGIQKKSVKQLETIDDILSSDLKLVLDTRHYADQYINAEGSARQLLNESTHYEISYQECLDLLVKYKDTVCLAREEIVIMNILNKLDANHDPVMKILETYFSMPGAIILESRSPYTRRFNLLLGRIEQAGLNVKWVEDNFQDLTASTNNYQNIMLRNLKSDKILKEFTIILFSLHFFSCVIFFLEIINPWIKHNHHCQRFYQAIDRKSVV